MKDWRYGSPFPSALYVEIFKFEKCVKYANENTDDIIYSTKYYIKYFNRAISVNLQHKPLNFGRLLVKREYREERLDLSKKVKLNLMSLEKRRSLTDVTFLYKVLNGNIDIDISKIIDFHSEADRLSLRSKDFLTLKKKYARI